MPVAVISHQHLFTLKKKWRKDSHSHKYGTAYCCQKKLWRMPRCFMNWCLTVFYWWKLRQTKKYCPFQTATAGTPTVSVRLKSKADTEQSFSFCHLIAHIKLSLSMWHCLNPLQICMGHTPTVTAKLRKAWNTIDDRKLRFIWHSHGLQQYKLQRRGLRVADRGLLIAVFTNDGRWSPISQ